MYHWLPWRLFFLVWAGHFSEYENSGVTIGCHSGQSATSRRPEGTPTLKSREQGRIFDIHFIESPKNVHNIITIKTFDELRYIEWSMEPHLL